jgi:predicted nucleotidyltransferase
MAKLDKTIEKSFADHKAELISKFDIESLAIFGSYSRGQENAASDIDILVRYKKTPGLFGFLELKLYLEQILGRPVDLVTEKALKKQLKEKILQEAVRVT